MDFLNYFLQINSQFKFFIAAFLAIIIYILLDRGFRKSVSVCLFIVGIFNIIYFVTYYTSYYWNCSTCSFWQDLDVGLGSRAMLYDYIAYCLLLFVFFCTEIHRKLLELGKGLLWIIFSAFIPTLTVPLFSFFHKEFFETKNIVHSIKKVRWIYGLIGVLTPLICLYPVINAPNGATFSFANAIANGASSFITYSVIIIFFQIVLFSPSEMRNWLLRTLIIVINLHSVTAALALILIIRENKISKNII